MKSVLFISCLCFGLAAAYTQKDRDEVNEWVKSQGFPVLKAFTNQSPKMLQTVLKAYGTVTNEDAFEHLSASDLEILYTAVSASNNCEMCLSFHAMALGGNEKVPKADIDALLDGGLPASGRSRNLAIAAKYSLAHKGVILPRERLHLEKLGFGDEEMLEIVYASGFMQANNMMYIHQIANGLELEEFLHEHGPFKNSVYAKKAEL